MLYRIALADVAKDVNNLIGTAGPFLIIIVIQLSRLKKLIQMNVARMLRCLVLVLMQLEDEADMDANRHQHHTEGCVGAVGRLKGRVGGE